MADHNRYSATMRGAAGRMGAGGAFPCAGTHRGFVLLGDEVVAAIIHATFGATRSSTIPGIICRC